MNNDNLTSTDKKITKNEILDFILEEYYRIFKEAISKKKDKVTNEIVQKLYKTLWKIISEKQNSDLLEIFFGFGSTIRRYTESDYYNFLKFSIKKHDNSRLILIRLIITLIQVTVLGQSKLEIKNLDQILTSTLFQINKLIIDNGDYELFKEEIKAFSMAIIEQPVKIQEDMIYNIYLSQNQLFGFNPDINEKTEFLSFLIKNKLTRNFGDWNVLSIKIDEFGCDLLNDMYKDEDHITSENFKMLIKIFEGDNIHKFGIKSKLPNYLISALIHRTFFMIGAYTIFKNKNYGFNAVDYISLLWKHTQPQDEGIITLNTTPIEFDEFWLINLFLFGGIDNEVWDDSLDYRIENFHEMHSYITQYFILTLIKSYNPSKDPFNCTLDKIYEMEDYYDIIQRVIFRKDDLIRQLDKMNKESKDLSSLIKSDIEINLKITVIDETQIFELAKKLINKIFENFIKYSDNLLRSLPLNDDKVSKAKKDLLKSYYENSKLPEIFNFKNNDILKGYIKIAYRPISPKDCLIKTSNVDCSIIWLDIGRIIARGEEKYFSKILMKNKLNITEKSDDTSEIFNEIKNMALNISNKGFEPNLLIIPSDFFSEIRSENVNYESPMFKSVIQNKYLKIDEKIKLKVFYPHNFEDFKDKIVIMDTKVINWTYKFDTRTKERLWIDIIKFEEDKSKVDVIVRSKIEIKTVNPKGIEILKIINS